jgi:uncharacterized protein involved in tolerance to divalent cations
MEDPAYGVVLVTVASSEQGKKIAHALVRDQLAACVNIFPIESVYMWQGEVDRGLEHQLIIKTDLNKFSELAQKKLKHSMTMKCLKLLLYQLLQAQSHISTGLVKI